MTGPLYTLELVEDLIRQGLCPAHLAARQIEGRLDEDTQNSFRTVMHRHTGSRDQRVDETLLALLTPLQAAGAVKTGDDPAVDTVALRRFVLGVLGWPPGSLASASLDDIAHAVTGFCLWHGLNFTSPAPRADFLHEMLTRFPDHKE